MAHQPLRIPSRRTFSAERRAEEIDKICNGFVAPGQANRQIYRVLLERLLPLGEGIPGPLVSESQVRAAVQALKPGYQDVFRRMRELQGEEGLTGIIKSGTNYQLVHLAVGQKREPRRPVPKGMTASIILEQGSRCNVCGAPIAADDLAVEADHRVPRRRGGASHRVNLQAICDSCNNAKSTQCTNCVLDCNTCGWARPEEYRPVKLNPEIVLRLNALAREGNRDVDELANDLLNDALSN